MKTIGEKIAIMTAYKEGKKIEARSSNYNGSWAEVGHPAWNWEDCDYRVKEEPQYIPYDSVLEVERDKWLRKKVSKGILRRITKIDFNDNTIYSEGYWYTMKELLELFEYADGTPCGKVKGEQNG